MRGQGLFLCPHGAVDPGHVVVDVGEDGGHGLRVQATRGAEGHEAGQSDPAGGRGAHQGGSRVTLQDIEVFII